MKFEIKGSPARVSLQEVRALLHSARTVLAYHNIELLRPASAICVRFVAKLENDWAGIAMRDINTIELLAGLPYTEMATVVIHELIHLHMAFPQSEEKLTSTLTAKLKDDVVRMANVLAENTQKRAAYIAHTKIAYKPVDGTDFYDMSQYHNSHDASTGEKYRKTRGPVPA